MIRISGKRHPRVVGTATHNGLATPDNGSEWLRNADSKSFFATSVIPPPADKTRLKTQKHEKQGVKFLNKGKPEAKFLKQGATVCLGAVEPLPDGGETAPEGQEAVSKIPGGVILLGRTDSGTKGNYATTGQAQETGRGSGQPCNDMARLIHGEADRYSHPKSTPQCGIGWSQERTAQILGISRQAVGKAIEIATLPSNKKRGVIRWRPF